MAAETNKRKIFLNDKPFQVGLAYKLGLVNLLGIGFLTLLFFIIAQDIVSTMIIKYEIGLPDPSNVLLFKNMPFTIGYFFIIVVFISLQSILQTITNIICVST